MTDSDKERAIRLCSRLSGIREPLEIYERMLLKWQARINLVGPSTTGLVWTRHFADSAQLADYAPIAGVWVDLGSGAGFPGLVIALLQRAAGAGAMHLIESDTRKAAFLREVSRETGAGAIVHNARCEDVLDRLAPTVITSRAMAALPDLWKYCRSHVENGAVALFLKGRDVEVELTKTPISSNFRIGIEPSKIDPGGAILRIDAI